MAPRVLRIPLFALLMALPASILMISVAEGYAQDEVPLDIASLALYGGVGGLVIFRRDGHLVGWLLTAVGAVTISVSRLEGIAISPAFDTWVGNFGWPLVFSLFTWLALVFPSGHLPTGSSKWAKYGRFAGRWLLPFLLFALMVSSGSTGPESGIDTANEDSIYWIAPWLLLMILFATSGVSLVVRRRRAVGVERAQLGWVVLPLALLGSIVLLTALYVVSAVLAGFPDPGDDPWIGVYLTILVFPLAFGIAVLRYKLYEIDRIISRTLSYALLTPVLAGLYLGVVFVLGILFPQQGDLAVAASTLLAAAAFNPIRRRIQLVVDRRFNRSRFDAERTLEALARRLASEVDLAALSGELVAVAGRTMQPAISAIWLRDYAG